MAANPLAATGAFPDLPQPDQIGFVVKDLERAIALYDPLFGPFTLPKFGPQTASYRGAEPTPYQLKYAFGSANGLEIELIQWVEGDTPHRDFIERGGGHAPYTLPDRRSRSVAGAGRGARL